MDLLFFIFKGSRSYYLVTGESENYAWESLANRLSCSLKNSKIRCKLIKILNGNDKVFKIKL